MRRVAILNSRQTKTPVAHDPWVLRTLAAVDYVVSAGDSVISSVGMSTWDLVTWRTAMVGGALELVLPIPNDGDGSETKTAVCRDFALNWSATRCHFLRMPKDEIAKKTWWPERDQTVTDMADVILPVSVRPNGLLMEFIARHGLKTNLRFQTEYKPRPHHVRELVDRSRLTPEIQDWQGDYLIHWTRSSNGPWPGETAASYFTDLIMAKDQFCRSAAKTLQRILQERVVRGSDWRVAGDQPVVSFTELPPVDSLALMRWRARWARWSFEPYGIAVHRDWATQQGARPVRYVSDTEWRTLAPEDKPYCHRIGKASGAWPAEREWRCQGDFSLRDAPPGAIRVIVRDETEKENIRDTHDCPIDGFMRAADA